MAFKKIKSEKIQEIGTNRILVNATADNLERLSKIKIMDRVIGSEEIDTIYDDKKEIDWKQTSSAIKRLIKKKNNVEGLPVFKSVGFNGKTYAFHMLGTKRTHIDFSRMDGKNRSKLFVAMLYCALIMEMKNLITEGREYIELSSEDKDTTVLFCVKKINDSIYGLKPNIYLDNDCLCFDANESGYRIKQEGKGEEGDFISFDNVRYGKKRQFKDNIPFINLRNVFDSHLFLLLIMRRAIINILNLAGISHNDVMFTATHMGYDFESHWREYDLDKVNLSFKEEDFNQDALYQLERHLKYVERKLNVNGIETERVPFNNYDEFLQKNGTVPTIVFQPDPNKTDLCCYRKRSDQKSKEKYSSSALQAIDEIMKSANSRLNKDMLQDYYFDTYSEIKAKRLFGMLNQTILTVTQGLIVNKSFNEEEDSIAIDNAIKALLVKNAVMNGSLVHIKPPPGYEGHDITVISKLRKRHIALKGCTTLRAVNDGYKKIDMGLEEVDAVLDTDILPVECNEMYLFGDMALAISNEKYAFRALADEKSTNIIIDAGMNDKALNKSITEHNIWNPRLTLKPSSTCENTTKKKIESDYCSVSTMFCDDGSAVLSAHYSHDHILKGKMQKDMPLMTVRLFRTIDGQYHPINLQEHPEYIEWYVSQISFDDFRTNGITKRGQLGKIADMVLIKCHVSLKPSSDLACACGCVSFRHSPDQAEFRGCSFSDWPRFL